MANDNNNAADFSPSDDQLRAEAIATGAYYWYRAHGANAEMLSALSRARYHAIVAQLRERGVHEPSSEQLYARAAELWPKGRLHPGPGDEA